MIALGKFVSFFSRSNCWFFFNYGCLWGNEVPFPMFISHDCDVHMVLFRIIHYGTILCGHICNELYTKQNFPSQYDNA